MTTLARSLSSLAHGCTAAVRVRTLAAALATSLVATLLVATPSHALVAEVEGVKVGLQPRNGTSLGSETLASESLSFANEGGNVVLHGSNDYAIYWDPNKQFHPEWLVNLDGFFHALGEADLGTPFSDLGQYRDRSNALTTFHANFKGSYSDTTKFPAAGCTDPNALVVGAVTCLTDAQLREQLQAFIASQGLPKGMSTVYYLLTPPGVTVCLDAAATRCSDYKLSKTEAEKEQRESVSYQESFCSYHGNINPDNAPEGDGNTILYAAIPWTAGDLGLEGYVPAARVYATSFDCQDGGFNPEKHEENRETERELTAEEEATLKKDTAQKRHEEEEARRLEGPHVEEPNQEGKGEFGDYSPGLSDVLVNQISEEEMNTVTDPLLSSWHNAAGAEATDLCRNDFGSTAGASTLGGLVKANPKTEAGTLSNVDVGGGLYYINNVFSFGDGGCAGGIGLIARFTAPNPVNVGEIIGVDGMESTVSLIEGDAFGPSGPPTLTYATFSWNFGDGTPEVEGFAPGAPPCEAPWLSPCAASAFHAYQYGGIYTVTLTITDVAGNRSTVTHQVTVDGPPAPSTSGAGTGAGAGATPGTGIAGSVIPNPIAAASILRQSLRNALRKGLVVSYSVNEQVAGHFEVLLSSALARRLGIAGTLATGLPAGSAPELVIAKAILVTTKGGHNAVHIQFSKKTAARLAHVHKLSLMLRLIVRNAAPTSPETTTVLTTATLTH